MTNQEVIETLKDILIEATETEDSICYVSSYDEKPLEMAIEALEKQETNGWILVSERLPLFEEKVIVSIKDDSADSPIYHTSVGWYYKGMWVVANEVSYQVIAWMPFPEPYKEY